MRTSTPPIRQEKEETARMPAIVLIAIIGLTGGVLSGLFGIGGGLVIVPALILVAGFPIATAAGTSLAALLLPVGLFGALEYYRAGHVEVQAAAVIAVGLLIGAYFGARLGTALPPEVVQRAFGIFLLIVGARLALFS
jgi:uncharacterized protein